MNKPDQAANLPEIIDSDPHLVVGAAAHNAMFEAQLASTEPHESEFNAFRLFKNKNCLVLDVGGNIGNSALSIHLVQPTWSVISFEPNIALNAYLTRVVEVYAKDGADYRFFNVGLADKSGALELFVPRIADWHVIGEASFDLQHFHDPVVKARLASYTPPGQKLKLSRVKCTVAVFDEFAPIQDRLKQLAGTEGLFVKMDVEGFELSALRGMKRFLTDRIPYLLIENDPADKVPEYLRTLGFMPFVYSATQGKLSALGSSRQGYLNIFYVHEQHLNKSYSSDFIL